MNARPPTSAEQQEATRAFQAARRQRQRDAYATFNQPESDVVAWLEQVAWEPFRPRHGERVPAAKLRPGDVVLCIGGDSFVLHDVVLLTRTVRLTRQTQYGNPRRPLVVGRRTQFWRQKAER